MKYDPPLEKYTVSIREVSWGSGEHARSIGGENTLPFHYFEGSLPNAPAIALEVLDIKPENWAPAVLAPFEDVVTDPAKWAEKCAETFKHRSAGKEYQRRGSRKDRQKGS